MNKFYFLMIYLLRATLYQALFQMHEINDKNSNPYGAYILIVEDKT